MVRSSKGFKTYFRAVVISFAVLCILLTYINFSRNPNEALIEVITQTTHNPYKVVLLWNKFFHNYDYMFGTDGKQFIGYNQCPVNNCIVTSNRNLRPVEDYDVIVIHGVYFSQKDGPPKRSPKQFYAFVDLETPVTNPLREDFIDYYNWTLTYRFDSDFVWPYFKLKNKRGEVISPAENPNWESHQKLAPLTNRSVLPTIEGKRRKVAWFVSHCAVDNKRGDYVKKLQQYIDVDVYGRCGPFKCSKKDEKKCYDMLRDNYYFYIAFENSHCIDYMTEKPYVALMYDTIPVVYGLANFTRYIPPHSYLDANTLKPEQLASIMNELIEKPDEYAKYFWWKSLYTFHNLGNEYILSEPDLHPFCEMCKALNAPELLPKTYKNMSEWLLFRPYNYKEQSKIPACVKPANFLL